METIRACFTVYFDDPFWKGVYERKDCDHFEVVQFTFGAMPEDADVLKLVLMSHQLDWFCEISDDIQLKKQNLNPKRKQKQVIREMQRQGIGTKSQQALSRMREEDHQQAKILAKERKLAQEQYQYAIKVRKRKEKHRGH